MRESPINSFPFAKASGDALRSLGVGGQHKSVLLAEAVEWLGIQKPAVIVDGTLGSGGHAEEILRRLGPKGKLIGFDKDPEAVREAAERLERFGEQAMIIRDDFKNIARRLSQANVHSADGVLLDLGVSSMQLDREQRGFSFSKNGPLDMRMDPQSALSATEIVNHYPEKELADIFWNFGQERHSRRIASRIVRERSRKKILTTAALEQVIFHSVPRTYRYGRIHPATRSFQALRIVVNDELGSLQRFLSEVVSLLKPRGRVVIISFHSLEDRLVKQAFREFERQGLGQVLTKKPVVAGEPEIQENPRARSAKLRVFEKA